MADTQLFFREMNNNLIHQDMSDEERREKNLRDITDTKMQTMEQFRQSELRLRDNREDEFVIVDQVKSEFYSMDRVQSNVLIIKELMDNANSLRLSPATMEDLDIRRNRLKDFELLNARTKSDSKEMRLLKEEIRNYDLALSYLPNNNETLTAFCKMMEEKCDDVIKRCDDYLKRGKSAKFWKSNRNDRYHLVEEARARYVNEREKIDRLSVLAKAGSAESFLEEGDSMMDLLNMEAIADRMTRRKAEEQQRKEREEARRKEQERKAEKRRKKDINDGMKQAKAINDLFANAEKQEEEEPEQLVKDLFVGVEDQQQNEQQEQQQNEQQENEHQEQQQNQQKEQHKEQQQQEQQQQELYGTKALDELKKLDKTPEMQAIEVAITAIQTEMAKEMPAVQVMDDKELEKKAERRARKGKDGVDALSVKIVRLFGALDQSIEECLKRENGAGYGGNDALMRILENLRKQTKVDRSQFKDKVVQYRSYIAGSAEEAAKNHTWFDAWKYVRSVSYDLDEKNNGLETKTTGAGSSMITLIKDTKKKQTVYFRQGESAGGWDSEELARNFMESIKGEIRLGDDIKENLKTAFGQIMDKDTLEWVKGASDGDDEEDYQNAIEYLETKDLSTYRGNSKTIEDFIQTKVCPTLLKDIYQNANGQDKEEIKKAFRLFAKKQFQWTFSFQLAKIDPEQSLTDRNVATSRLAGYLGISSMVSDSRTAVIKKDGKEVMGNVMEDSRGKEIEEMEGEWTYSDKAIGQVYTLQVFDMICGQIDRHKKNYHIIEKNHNVNSIKAIDNDMSFGGLKWADIEKGHQRITILTECHVRAMPIAVINQILSLDKTVLQEALGDILDSKCMEALRDRLEGVKKSIIEYAKKEEAGLKISEDGKTAEFTGEDKDDTLRMLKAVLKQRKTDDYEKIDGGEWEWYENLIEWNHLTEKTLNDKIDARKKVLAQGNNKNKGGNQQA